MKEFTIRQTEKHEGMTINRIIHFKGAQFVTRDTRDKRDPAILGGMLLEMRTLLPDEPLTEVYDRYHLTFASAPHYPGDYTTVKETVEAYRSKMQQQAIEGDIYAIRVLLDHKWKVPSEVDQNLVTRAMRTGSSSAEIVGE